jgi:hypothetical protein
LDHSTSSFLCGYAVRLDLFVCVKEQDKKSADGMVFNVFLLQGNTWAKFATMFDWPHVAVASIKPRGSDRVVLSIGGNGDYWEFLDATSSEHTGVIPGSSPFLARNLAVVGDRIFAVGMGRVVARWDGPGLWTRLGPTAPLPEGRACGFNDLTGPSLMEMYAVGWRGEIWQTDGDGSAWRQIDSPISEHLNAACTLRDGSIVAVGYNGAMVRGKHDTWAVVASGRPETLLDVCCFKGEVYVATAFRILKLEDTGLMPVTEFADADDVPTSCGALYLTDDGVGVFSLGPKDLFRLRDGAWERVV